jgi:periplasmic mercuric ion binding protein
MARFSTLLALGLLIVSSGGAVAEQRTVTLVENMYCEACPFMVKKLWSVSPE